jgi:hypothetical protein
MSRRYFTVGEVDRLVPRLEQIFVHLLQLRAALRTQQEKLERAGITITPETLATLEDDSPGDTIAVRQGKLMFRAYYDELGERLAEIQRLGGQVKDLDTGLVDFLARRRDEDILLCWKLGERNVQYWHTLEAGFGGRQRIDAEVLREPPSLD